MEATMTRRTNRNVVSRTTLDTKVLESKPSIGQARSKVISSVENPFTSKYSDKSGLQVLEEYWRKPANLAHYRRVMAEARKNGFSFLKYANAP